MKVKKGFVVYESGGEYIMTGVGEANFHGMIRSNEVAAFIVECLSEDTTREQIIDKMFEKYDADRETLGRGVDSVLETLRKIGAIDE